ncbi:hypothetical protein B7P43_G13779 [Cryptotermes secundus]|uniref:Reverse transcriptase domain-containing protein n=1 Tax=Cryptotermes secundus TaxID=105785 RepID=A0A2J7RKW8_9NEOP|nr:hypothetical protein B7P43_G13779 [Cryptotermes secundus]
MEAWCERWNIKINEDKTRGICFCRSNRPSESHLALNGRNIPFVNTRSVNLGVIFDKKVTWRFRKETIEAKAFRTFITIYSLFKSERLSANIKLTIATHYAVFFNLLSLHSSSVQIFSSAPCSQTHSIYIPPLMPEIKFYTHTEP